MKFSELKIGDEFKDNRTRYGLFFKINEIKDSEVDDIWNAISKSGNLNRFNANDEVTQINKKACENCKHFHIGFYAGMEKNCEIYENKYWDLFRIKETPKALFEFDGHTGKDVIDRLQEVL